MLCRMRRLRCSAMKRRDVNCDPLSLWKIAGQPCLRQARPSAVRHSSVSPVFDRPQPTIRREYRSMMKTACIMPPPTLSWVRSQAHTRLGASGCSCSSRLGAGWAPRRGRALLCGPGESESRPTSSISPPPPPASDCNPARGA